MAEIFSLPRPMSLSSRLECSKCGATTDAVCNCGVGYAPAWKRAAEAVAASPEKSDRMIAKENGVSHRTVGRARRKQATGADAPVEKRVGADGKRRAMPGGIKLTVPNGYASFAEAMASGIENERNNGASAKEAATRLGFSLLSYMGMRDIVLLSKRTDLSLEDTKLTLNALNDLETTHQITQPLKTIRPIALKIWGHKGHRFKSEAKRLEAFLSSISMVHTVCTSASEINIPHLSENRQKAASNDLMEAIGALSKLAKRIEKGD